MLSQFYLDPIIMSKENARKSQFDMQRSNNTTDSNSDPSKKTVKMEHIVNGSGVTKSDIAFLKNLSENILSVKDTETDFCYHRADSYKRHLNKSSHENSSVSSFENLKLDDGRCLRRKKHPVVKETIKGQNNSNELKSKRNSARQTSCGSSKQSSVEKYDNKSNINKRDCNNNNNDDGGPCLSPRLLEPTNTTSRKNDYNDANRYEKFKRYHENDTNSFERRSRDSDDSHSIETRSRDSDYSLSRTSYNGSSSHSTGRCSNDDQDSFSMDRRSNNEADSTTERCQENGRLHNTRNHSHNDIMNRLVEIRACDTIRNYEVGNASPDISRNHVIENGCHDDNGNHIYENIYYDDSRIRPVAERSLPDSNRPQNTRAISNGRNRRIEDRSHENFGCFTIESSSSASSDSSDLEIMDEWKRMDSIFTHINPFILVDYLRQRVKDRDLNALHQLSILLPKSKFTGKTSHCVRCHKEYDPVHGDMECILHHDVKDVDLVSQDNDCALFQCERCFAVFRLYGEFEYTQSNASKCGNCFTGIHTSIADEVVYEPEGVAKRCVNSGCSVIYV